MDPAQIDARIDTDTGAQIDQVRRFNRTVTERVGVLHDHYLGQDRPIGEARLLWEVGEQGQDVRRLRERLGLDSGYLSRLLRSLEADGLVTVEPQPRDRRLRTVRLTDAGRAERAALDARSDELAASLLEPLNATQRARLVAAMAEVDRLLTAATVTVDTVDPDHPDARHCLRSYYAEIQERFETGFDPARSLLPDAGELRPPRGLFLVARLHGEPVGCAGLKLLPDAPSEPRSMTSRTPTTGSRSGSSEREREVGPTDFPLPSCPPRAAARGGSARPGRR
ncbi:MarR family winged helix-turn-helix transcriptional regulator [Kitasatospora sp. NPDC058190]|uniref:MarR family winged helix-turn-helix transcriptional regulator n=1 Tax=Kitasatospora sp. NPDC058190 TaxID=3346371 RepID=UPI0036DC2294